MWLPQGYDPTTHEARRRLPGLTIPLREKECTVSIKASFPFAVVSGASSGGDRQRYTGHHRATVR